MHASVHHNSHARTYQPSDDRPRMSYGTIDDLFGPLTLDGSDDPPQQSARAHTLEFLHRCLTHIAFLLVNAVAAMCASLLLLALLGCALALLPLCCVGVLVFQLTFRLGVLELLAHADIALVNLISGRESQIELPSASASERDGFDPLHPLLREDRCAVRAVSGLRVVSLASLMTLLYFVGIKCVLALLGLFIVSIVLWSPAALLHLIVTAGAGNVWDAICGGLLLALVFAVAVGSLDVVTQLSCVCTRLFCCERVRESPRPSVRAASTRQKVVVVDMDSTGRFQCTSARAGTVA